MPRNEDGEFELILGNKQLLSVFFIVVILLGVFFTMGYIVGRNSSPVTADGHKPDKPTVVDGRNSPAPVIEPGPTAQTAPPSSEPASTKPAVDETPAPVAAPPPAPKKEEKPEPKKSNKEKEREAKAEAKKEKEKAKEATPERKPQGAGPTPDQPVPGGKYLQVAAVAKPEAQLFVDVLAKKGFRSIYAQHPDQPQTFRVLVGPFKEAAAIAQARTDLEKAGFQGMKAIVRTY